MRSGLSCSVRMVMRGELRAACACDASRRGLEAPIVGLRRQGGGAGATDGVGCGSHQQRVENNDTEHMQEKHETARLVAGVEPLEPVSVRTSLTRQRIRRRADSGDATIDEKIAALVADIGVQNVDLLQDTIETAVRIARKSNRGEMKLVRRSLHELDERFACSLRIACAEGHLRRIFSAKP